ncbi:MAG: PHP domain-containing protein [Methanospirillaceae archaeon]|nr:PHP domain-containing protein [Methanospirillaceae archaeon]
MSSDNASPVRYSIPDISALRKDGYYPIDMHLHTTHSDGIFRIPDLIPYAKKLGIGVAITDHNEISGVLQAVSEKRDILVIPGIELETQEGPHILLYFYTSGDLADFFHDFTRERNRETPGLLQNLSVSDCLSLAESYDCLRIAAHPFGYYGINRGILKCVLKNMLPGVLDHIDGIEVICGGMVTGLNRKAMRYAAHHPMMYTGGSDAHILSDVGSVVTGVRADTVDEFLDGIASRKNVVMGRSSGCIHKGATAGVIAWSFIPYTVSRLSAHYSVYNHHTSRLFQRYQSRVSSFFLPKREEKMQSEERREEP